MILREYNSGKRRCVSCGKTTFHTRKVNEEIRVRVCRKCERILPVEFWAGVIAVDAKRVVGETTGRKEKRNEG